MKICISALLCFLTSFFFSQKKYNFDYFINTKTYDVKEKKEDSFAEFFYNSETHQRLLIKREFNTTLAFLQPKQDDETQVFSVKQEKDFLQIAYHHTSKCNCKLSENSVVEQVFVIEKLNEFTFLVTVYKNGKKRTKNLVFEVVFKESDVDFYQIPLGNSKISEINAQIRSLLNPNKKYIVYRLKSRFAFGDWHEDIYTTTFQKVDLLIEQPKDLIIKNSDAYWKEFQN